MLLRELFCALSNKINMRTSIKHQPRRMNRIAQTLDACDASGAQRASVHQQCIQFHAPIAGEKTAASGIEGVIVFENGYGSLNGIHCRCAFRKQGVSGMESIGNAALMRRDHIVGNGPGAPVNQEYRCVWHTRLLIVSGKTAMSPSGRMLNHIWICLSASGCNLFAGLCQESADFFCTVVQNFFCEALKLCRNAA